MEETKHNYWLYAFCFLGIIIILIIYWLKVSTYYNDDLPRQGQFGDTFGAANALFTGLAFAGLIITIVLQLKELGLQREELRATRSEFNEQNKTLNAKDLKLPFLI